MRYSSLWTTSYPRTSGEGGSNSTALWGWKNQAYLPWHRVLCPVEYCWLSWGPLLGERHFHGLWYHGAGLTQLSSIPASPQSAPAPGAGEVTSRLSRAMALELPFSTAASLWQLPDKDKACSEQQSAGWRQSYVFIRSIIQLSHSIT